MTYVELLDRRNLILKRNISNMVMKDNRRGLNTQESHFYQSMIKEMHQNENEIHAAKKQS